MDENIDMVDLDMTEEKEDSEILDETKIVQNSSDSFFNYIKKNNHNRINDESLEETIIIPNSNNESEESQNDESVVNIGDNQMLLSDIQVPYSFEEDEGEDIASASAHITQSINAVVKEINQKFAPPPFHDRCMY